MYANRILKLAEHMAGIDAKTYYQNQWMTAQDGGRIYTEQVDVGEELMTHSDGIPVRKIAVKEGACNTAMCVLGHAVEAVPEANMFFMTYDAHLQRNGRLQSILIARVNGNGDVEEGFKMAAKAFGIPEKHAEVLFGFYSKDCGTTTYDFYGEELTNVVVAEKLREYVETKGANVQAVLI